MKVLLVLLFCISAGYAQEVLVEGYIVDEKNGKPIPYANLSFLNTLKGTSSDEKGHFYIDVPESYVAKKVHISSLGFRDTILPARTILERKEVRMSEDTYELDEVVVSKSLGDVIILNPISSYKIKSGFSSAATPWVLATYFPNIGASKKYIDKITIHVQNETQFKRTSSKFRLRIYDVDKKTKKPNRDLILKSIILESMESEDFVSIDLSSIGIKVPQEGVYIGLEWLFLPFNWYANTFEHPISKKKIVEDRFAPTFAAVYQKNQNYRTMVYGMGEWSDFSIKARGNSQNLIPAVTLKLSKEK